MKLKQKNLEDKLEHNRQVSVSRLPFEVLSLIFCHLRDSFLDFIAVNQDPDSFTDDHEPWCWTTVTQVCHAWRVTALNAPALWSHIVLSPDSRGRWPQEMCRLSKQTSLNIILHSVNPLDHEIMHHMKRCHILSIYHGAEPLDQVLSTMDTARLEYLLIYDICWDPPEDPPFIFCDDILHAESLRRLRLHGCCIDWTSTLLRRLTHLTLEDIREECRLSCSDFIALLGEMPALEVLHLARFIKKEDNFQLSKLKLHKICLPNLKFLDLSCLVHEMAGFLHQLNVPSMCRLSLRAWDTDKRITLTFNVILAWLAHHYRLPPPFTISDGDCFTPQHPLRSLCLYHSSPFFKIKGFFENLSYSHVGVQRDPIFEFTTIWGLEESDRFLEHLLSTTRLLIDDSILGPYLSFLPLDRIAYLEVSTDSGLFMSEDLWSKAFSSIKTLEQIFLDSDALPFLTALTPTPHSWRSRPFPALSSIAYNDSIDFESIVACLQARTRVGLKLKEFLFPLGCAIPAITMEKLEKVVSYVGFHSR